MECLQLARSAIGAAAVVFSLAVAGCTLPALSGPIPLRMHTAADTAAYARASARGTGTITGQAFLKTLSGDVKLGAGNPVTLDLLTPYTLDWFRQVGSSSDRFVELPPDSAFIRARRSTVVDAQGNFQFSNVPAGTYLIRSIVTWYGGYPQERQGGVVADTLTLADHEHRQIILNTVATPGTGPRAEIIALANIGDRKYKTLGEATGISCKESLFDPPPSESIARNDLATNAARMEADAVTNVTCESSGMSLRHNCSSMITCKGLAIQWL